MLLKLTGNETRGTDENSAAHSRSTKQLNGRAFQSQADFLTPAVAIIWLAFPLFLHGHLGVGSLCFQAIQSGF